MNNLKPKFEEILKKQFHFVNKASIQYYIENDNISGTFLTCLNKIQSETAKVVIEEISKYCQCQINSGLAPTDRLIGYSFIQDKLNQLLKELN